jgi:hypothetical protein
MNMECAHLGVRRVLNHFSHKLCLSFVVVSFSDGVNHFNCLPWHIRIPFVVLSEGIEAYVCLCLADIADDLVNDSRDIPMAGHHVCAAVALAIVFELGRFGYSDGLLVSMPPLEAQPLTESFGHLRGVAQVATRWNLRAGD